MTKICIVGAGTAGTILALELSKLTNHEIILLDSDNLTNSFNNNFDLKKFFYNFSDNYKTTGYGFGGSSNLWHGVLTNLDDEDFFYINKVVKKDIKNELKKYSDQLTKYFGKLHFTDEKINKQDQFDAFLDLSKFIKKKFTVQRSPTRFRKLLKKRLSSYPTNLKIIENAIAIKLIKKSNNEIKELLYFKDGKQNNIFADFFIICMGGLGSPRLLLQSFEKDASSNKFIGKGLIDHPFAIIGQLLTNKYTLYKQFGITNLIINNSERIGYRIKKDYRLSTLNHSIFIRPGMTKNIKKMRQNLKLLIYKKFSLKMLFSIIFNFDIFKLSFSLLSEKFGIGYFSKNFIVTMQLEQTPNKSKKVILSKNYDKFNRRIPEIHEKISDDILPDIKNLQDQFIKIISKNCKFEKFKISHDDLISGAHYSGTCRMGSDKNSSVVDSNLQYHDMKNLYVCDSSVIPKIGNANLVFTISALSIRLANYLKKLTRNK
jgi:hypothetical protein|tara:strand:- start:5818 stop:7278 length:1461 start_codon:yes stop_codon:yes gene_type:complete